MLLLILAKFQVCELNDLGRVGLNILERPCFKSVQLLDTRALSLSSWRHRFSNLIMFLEMICSSHSLTSSQLLVTLFYQLGATHPALPILRHQLCSQLGHMGWPDDDYRGVVLRDSWKIWQFLTHESMSGREEPAAECLVSSSQILQHLLSLTINKNWDKAGRRTVGHLCWRNQRKKLLRKLLWN